MSNTYNYGILQGGTGSFGSIQYTTDGVGGTKEFMKTGSAGSGPVLYNLTSVSASATVKGGAATFASVTTAGAVVVGGDLTVNGTTTTVNSTTVQIDDLNLQLADGTDAAASVNGGGITLANTGDDFTFQYNHGSTAWKSSIDVDAASGKAYKINGTSVLNATTLGSAVVASSLTSVGALNGGSITSGFGGIDIGSSTFNAGASTVDSLDASSGGISNAGAIAGASSISGSAKLSVGSIEFGGTDLTATAAELNYLDNDNLTAADITKLAALDATAAEINILDGDTAASSVTVADADRIVLNDGGTMKQVAMTDFETYFESALDTLSNVTTVGALDAGSISSNFGNINIGTSTFNAGAMSASVGMSGSASQFGSFVLGGSSAMTAIKDEDNMASDSNTALATQQSIKAYVDAQITAQDLDFKDGDGNMSSVDLDSQMLQIQGTANEISTAASGQTLTISLPDDVTIGQHLTVTGELKPTSHIVAQGSLTLKTGGNTVQLGESGNKLSAVYATNVYTGDFHMKNERGDWTLFEESDYLRIRNNKTGQEFKMDMTPIKE